MIKRASFLAARSHLGWQHLAPGGCLCKAADACPSQPLSTSCCRMLACVAQHALHATAGSRMQPGAGLLALRPIPQQWAYGRRRVGTLQREQHTETEEPLTGISVPVSTDSIQECWQSSHQTIIPNLAEAAMTCCTTGCVRARHGTTVASKARPRHQVHIQQLHIKYTTNTQQRKSTPAPPGCLDARLASDWACLHPPPDTCPPWKHLRPGPGSGWASCERARDCSAAYAPPPELTLGKAASCVLPCRCSTGYPWPQQLIPPISRSSTAAAH